MTQINRSNVGTLTRAWSFDTKEAGGLQTQPIVVNGVLYAITPKHRTIALDGATGQLLWSFDSGTDSSGPNRGVAYWRAGTDERIFTAADQFLYCLDARTGRKVPSFADGGKLDLRTGLGRTGDISVRLTSPGTVYKDLLIIGGRVSESIGAPPGDIRAIDVRTGAVRWQFHTIPHPGEFGHDTWPKDAWTFSGSANNWAGMSLDEVRGIVYVPTGSAVADLYGADRSGDNLFANSIVALDATTGQRLWHFQIVHHDLLDRDLPAAPTLVTVTRNGRSIDALAQITKQGYVFLLDRLTGAPLFPVEEKEVPASTVPGETTSATQPIPSKPAPFSRQGLTAEILTTRTPEAHRQVLESFQRMRSGDAFLSLAVDQETVVFPGFDGGAEWGGAAYDPETHVLFVNESEMAWAGSLTLNEKAMTGRGVYLAKCAACHSDDLQGAPPQFPALVDLGKRRTSAQLQQVVRSGVGRMPSFESMSGNEMTALERYLLRGEDVPLAHSERTGMFDRFVDFVKALLGRSAPIDPLAAHASKYRFTGYKRFLDPEGYPAMTPPWGTLNAINLETGEYAWKIPLGEYPALTAAGVRDTGSENYGGPIVTAGGLVFIGATNFDRKFRAFDKDTGALRWETTLPFAGNATPATYEIDGRQFVTIAAGGGKDPKSQSGGVYVAFALPR